MPAIVPIQPSAVLDPGEAGPVDFSAYTLCFLAQGDSWFSFGSADPLATGNLINPIVLAESCCAVNCAVPGRELVHMVDARRDPHFISLLLGQFKMAWSGILLSGGGNDLIDAIGTPPVDAQGQPVDPSLRLLLTPAERGTVATVEGYISEAGWATFETHLVAQFHEFVALRDDPRSLCAGVPIFVHTYDFITPRDAGAGLGNGPWLEPVLSSTYAVDPADWSPLAAAFLVRLRDLMEGLGLPNLHVAQTQGTLTPAAIGSRGDSNDWENEIHPDQGGYTKLAKVYSALIDSVLP